MEIGCSMLAGASLIAPGCTSAVAEVTGALGSPEATITVKQLPPSIQNSAGDASELVGLVVPRGRSPI